MNKFDTKWEKWVFPEQIKFEEVSLYLQKFEKRDHNSKIIFDLTKTKDIHSSFIGFLIHAKHNISQECGSLVLLLSFTAEKIFTMLNILDYFLPEIISNNRISA